MILRHTADREGKLLSFLRGELGLSYGLLKRLKYQDAYAVNGVAVHTNHRVQVGDIITATIEENGPAIPSEHGSLTILYEDEAIIALDKPPGILMHPTFHRMEGTLANRLLGYYERTGQKSAVHLVSRLDRDTCGIVLAAKNAHIHARMCGQMQNGRIEKHYHAAVYGTPPAESGTICHPIARLSPTSLLRCVREDGKPAMSSYHILQRNQRCTLLALQPHTGRTHQLRVHCAQEDFPILGDIQYGSEESIAFSGACGYTHQQLCAVSLRFSHPVSGEEMVIRSEMDVRLP